MGEPVIIRSRGNTYLHEVQAGKHQFILDEPPSAGGSDSGPTPYDALAAALGGCTSMTLLYYAKREGLPLEGVELSITHDREHAKDCADCMTESGYIHRFRVVITLKGPLTEEQRQHLLTIARRCPVAKMLQSEIKIDEELG